MAECRSVFFCGSSEAVARTFGFASPFACAALRFESLVLVDVCSFAGELLFCSAFLDGASALGFSTPVLELGLLPFLSGEDFDSAADRLSAFFDLSELDAPAWLRLSGLAVSARSLLSVALLPVVSLPPRFCSAWREGCRSSAFCLAERFLLSSAFCACGCAAASWRCSLVAWSCFVLLSLRSCASAGVRPKTRASAAPLINNERFMLASCI